MGKVVFFKILFFSIFFKVFGQNYDLGCYVKDPAARYREHNVDFKKLHLEVSFVPKKGEVKGLAHYTFNIINPLVDTLFLDAIEMKINKITIEGEKDPSFVTNKTSLVISLKDLLRNKSFKLKKDYVMHIDYQAWPKKGLYFIGWNDSLNLAQKQIWSQGQGIDNRHWIPGFDDQSDKLITGLTVHFDKKYEVISNGLQKEVKVDPSDPNKKIWTYEMTLPHSLYLIMLGIGEYKYKDMISKSGVVSRQYYYPARENAFNSTYLFSNEMMDWMEEETGVKYPWNKLYRNVPVQDFIHGAMENTMATVFTDFNHQDARCAVDRSYIATNAHELAHQWFGDLITEWSGTHHWLHESYATHYSKHFMKHQLGEEEFDRIRLEEMWSAIEADKSNRFPVAHSEAGSAKHYPKGSFVLDMLRYVLGNENYRRSITAYLKKHGYRNVDSHDLYVSIFETTGINLDWFFDQWIYRSSNPIITTSYASENGKIRFICKQTLDSAPELKPFKMPATLEVFYKDGSRDSSTQWISNIADTFYISNPTNKAVNFILFDAKNQILKRYRPNRTFDETIEQVIKAPYAIAKYEAVLTLADTAIAKKKAAYLKIYDQVTFLPLKYAIINQLGKDTIDVEIQKFLLAQMKHPNVFVRREAIQNIKIDNQDKKNAAIQMLRDTSYNNIKTALDKLAKNYPNEAVQFANMTRPLAGMNKNIEIDRHRIIIQQANGQFDKVQKNIDSLLLFASASFEFRTRNNAIETLAELNVLNSKYLPIIIDAYLSFNNRLASPAHTAMKKYLSQPENKSLIVDFCKKNVWSESNQLKINTLLSN